MSDKTISVDRLFLEIGSLPQLLDVVELPYLRAEDMDDHVTRIDQHPVRAREAFDARLAHASTLDRLDQVFGDGADMAVRAARGDDHVVAEAGLALNVDGDDVFGLGVFQTGKDCLDGAFGLIVAALRGRRRHGICLLPKCCSQSRSFRTVNTKSLATEGDAPKR